ncbi:MAG: ParB/RepB/Spo0J family partition protein [Candidatus Levybacteria bacterium]|nr:ParB/RepB/Spo0J family partition protein [Candidatus Levybacteria bacterium]
MISFKNFLIERIVDPEQLAVRVAKKYGKRTSYGSWLKAKKHEHIPLSNYNRVDVNKVENKLYKYQKKLGMYPGDFGASEQEQKKVTARANEASANYKKKFSDKTMKISDLHATQPFIRTDDMEQLKNKISNKTSSDIMVIKHNDKHYIMDGHHTVMAAKFRGEKDVNVKYLDLDTETSKKKGVNENIDNYFINENKINHSNIIDNENGLIKFIVV